MFNCGTCCSSGCGPYGGYSGLGGYGGGYDGNEGVVTSYGTDKTVLIKTGGSEVIYSTPFMYGCGDINICWEEVCAADCCSPCRSGSFYGGRGGQGVAPGLLVNMQQPGSAVIIPRKILLSNYKNATVTKPCSDTCPVPC